MSAALPASPHAVSAQERTCRASDMTGWSAEACLAAARVVFLAILRDLRCVAIANSAVGSGSWRADSVPCGILNVAAG